MGMYAHLGALHFHSLEFRHYRIKHKEFVLFTVQSNSLPDEREIETKARIRHSLESADETGAGTKWPCHVSSLLSLIVKPVCLAGYYYELLQIRNSCNMQQHGWRYNIARRRTSAPKKGWLPYDYIHWLPSCRVGRLQGMEVKARNENKQRLSYYKKMAENKTRRISHIYCMYMYNKYNKYTYENSQCIYN